MATYTNPAALPPPSGLSVLFVEDDAADAHLIIQVLLRHPAVGVVTHASDGVEALKMVRDGKVEPDLAFIDLHMPRKNGFDLMVALSEDPKGGFPMVVLTSSSSPTDASRSRLRSALRFVTKSESLNLLEKSLNTAIVAACPAAAAKKPATRRERLASLRAKAHFTGIDDGGYDRFE